MTPVEVFHIAFPVVTLVGGWALGHVGIKTMVTQLEADIAAIKAKLP